MDLRLRTGFRYAADQLVSDKFQYDLPVGHIIQNFGQPDVSNSKDQFPGCMIETSSLNTSNSTRKRRPIVINNVVGNSG